MLETFLITANQLSVLWIFLLCGYILKKKKIIPDASGSVLSNLELYIFLPALNIKTFSANFRTEILRENLYFILVAAGVVGASFAAAVFLAKLFSKNPLERDIFRYCFTIPNIGYMGYPLVGAVFGEKALFFMMVYTIPYNTFIYTAGMYILNPQKQMSVKKVLNPIILSLAAGMIIGLSDIALPKILADATSAASACMAPVAMVLTGFVLAKQSVKTMLGKARIYLVSLFRLLLLPAAIGTVLYLAGARGNLLLVAVAASAMPCGLNSVVFPEAFGGDSKTGAQLCFVSNILGLLTIPLVFGILAGISRLAGSPAGL